MATGSQPDSRLRTLLDLKRNLSLGGETGEAELISQEPAKTPLPGDTARACVNCGYEQQGQLIDRCPECGLLWASRLCDPTPWANQPVSVPAFWLTALRVWSCDRRTRIRTSIVPSTPESRRFGRWVTLPSTVMLAVAFACVRSAKSASLSDGILEFMVSGVIALACVGGGLTLTLAGGRLALRGRWRRTLHFVPACIDYSSAWWLPFSLALMLTAAAFLGLRRPAPAGLFTMIGVYGVVAWAWWLWVTVGISEQVRYVGPRLLVTIFIPAVVTSMLLATTPGFTKSVVSNMQTRWKAAQTVVPMQTWAPSPLGTGPDAWALVIDLLPGTDDSVVPGAISTLGVPAQNILTLRESDATLAGIESALRKVNQQMTSRSQFIFYINGHGSENGAGSIEVADGFLTSQKLRYLLSELKSSKNLVIIDSCFGGKFIGALRGVCDATVMTATDDRNLAYRSGLWKVWPYLVRPEADLDQDGYVTIGEAFWKAYPEMLENLEKARTMNLERSNRTRAAQFSTVGYATPQLEEIGKATPDEFKVKLPGKTP